MEEDTKPTEAQVILDAGKALGSQQILFIEDEKTSIPFVIVPRDMEVKSLESQLLNPVRIKATPSFDDLKSFIGYVNRFKNTDTTIFAAITDSSCSLSAVIDYHNPEKPAWRQHVASYKCPLSKEWREWTAKNGVDQAQQPFAEFLENNLPDISKPEGARILEIATTLQAKTNVDFASSLRLQNGNVKLNYVEKTEATAGVEGNLEIPEAFQITIPPFVRGAAYVIDVRLRYYLRNRSVAFRYELVRPHKVIEDAMTKVVEEVADGTGITPLMGAS